MWRKVWWLASLHRRRRIWIKLFSLVLLDLLVFSGGHRSLSSSSQNCKTTADLQKGIVHGGMIRQRWCK
ncbi:hypothetical protein HRI_002359300 [Hibiscus trionum]|uniref:Secreted protein n=1 Tax=Hibiscus trionum TaxID=183268 RepID=A0A9W7M5Y5_HIBTR|nr:hypothetical protein HRI_002359300 [Hibiscus trionum]